MSLFFFHGINAPHAAHISTRIDPDTFAGLSPACQKEAILMMVDVQTPALDIIRSTGLAPRQVIKIARQQQKVPASRDNAVDHDVVEARPLKLGEMAETYCKALLWFADQNGQATISFVKLQQAADISYNEGGRRALAWLIHRGYLEAVVKPARRKPGTYAITAAGRTVVNDILTRQEAAGREVANA
ncbi:hypothetical protein [Rhizobium sp. SSA_523]|uniref:hypothetical protein n=1 Tax=Rhizobium sp. SSA_523 TaxID=2952477 RepID=UPI00209166BB|nr:hypothetical protein [Rhizobium sp. SSA_523]MCO5734109.1 hypothetical protein [Rhizobium sp. SSA_523]WKC24746.1 hypothetical protein QTJ18_12020 [Rhizobium sp. SSA_523]